MSNADFADRLRILGLSTRDAPPQGFPATVAIDVDGAVVYTSGTYTATYHSSIGSYSLLFAQWGGIQLLLPSHVTTSTPVGDCLACIQISVDTRNRALYWPMDQVLPPYWRGLMFWQWTIPSEIGRVTEASVELTVVRPTEVAGRYNLVVEGAGLRGGSILHFRGGFRRGSDDVLKGAWRGHLRARHRRRKSRVCRYARDPRQQRRTTHQGGRIGGQDVHLTCSHLADAPLPLAKY